MKEDGTPEGFECVARFTVGSIYVGKGQVVVLGMPKSDDESHNCDAMGCGQDHVVYRARIVEESARGA